MSRSEMPTHQAEQTDQDQVDRDHVVQYARDDQDQDARDQSDQGRGGGCRA